MKLGLDKNKSLETLQHEHLRKCLNVYLSNQDLVSSLTSWRHNTAPDPVRAWSI